MCLVTLLSKRPVLGHPEWQLHSLTLCSCMYFVFAFCILYWLWHIFMQKMIAATTYPAWVLHGAVAMLIRLSIIMLSKEKFLYKLNSLLSFVSSLQWKPDNLFISKICHVSNPGYWNIGENLVFIFRHLFIQLLLMNTQKCHVWFCFQLLTENLPVPRGPVGLN